MIKASKSLHEIHKKIVQKAPIISLKKNPLSGEAAVQNLFKFIIY